ncbi:MAG: cyclic peptide export ABC transporter [Rhizobacter sp.]
MNEHEATAAEPRTNYRFHIIRLMWDSHPWLTIAMALSGVLSGLAAIAVVDTINNAIHHADRRAELALVFVGLSVATIVLRNCSSILPAYAAMTIITRLRVALCKRILGTPMEEIDKRGTANVLTLLSNDVPVLTQTLMVLPSILVESATFIFGMCYLAYLSVTALLLTLAAMTIGITGYLLFFRRGMVYSRKVRDEVATFTEHTYALLFGMKELKLNGHRRRWFRRAGIDFTSRKVARLGFIEQLWFSGGSNIEQISMSMLMGFLVFGAPSLQVMDPATITASVLAVMMVMGPVTSLVGTIPQLGEGTIACERLADFGFSVSDRDTPLLADQRVSIERQPKLAGFDSIELCGVRADYHDFEAASSFELGPVDLRIRAGEIVFIVGGNGSGKSTLAKVLCGLYTPAQGQVLLDGQVVSEASVDAYRSLFSAVFTDFYLFSRVLGDAGAADPLMDRAKEYLERLGLEDKVQVANGRYSTTTALSNGQRKRLALLGAYLEDRPIYLLDEWAADQDPFFKSFFYNILLPDLRSRGKCVVVISHDDKYFSLADRIVKLADGKVESNLETHADAPDHQAA